MAFVKTSNPIWYIDDTIDNVAAAIKDEKLNKEDILFAVPSATSGQIVVFVKKGSSRYL